MALGRVKVLEYAQMVTGPYCTRLQADLGAEVGRRIQGVLKRKEILLWQED
jgi:crotonobetainyl-CoA:carnitine CoA-transferase CaiB-like acyl-CoA transferase